MKSFVLACCVFLTVSVVIDGQDLNRETNKRSWKSRGGWSLNSVGYNGGLKALKQFIRRRSSDGYDEANTEDVNPQQNNEYQVGMEFPTDTSLIIDTLMSEFDLFLKLKESGNFDEEIINCLMTKAEREPEDF